MSTIIGDLLVKLSADTGSYKRAMKEVSRITDNSTKQVSKLLKDHSETIIKSQEDIAAAATRAAAALALAYTAGIGLSIREFVKFDQAMTQSTAIMRGMTSEMDSNLRSLARTLSKEGIQSARQLAEGYQYLTMAGLDYNQVVSNLPVVQKFATAGMFSMKRATDLLTDSQSALGLTVKDAAQNQKNMIELSDAIVRANTIANASTEQFARSLTSKAGAQMRMYNKDMYEGLSILAAYADQGTKAELAGERLAILIRDLGSAQVKNFEIWRQMGVTVFDEQTENMRPLVDIIRDLEGRFDGLGDAQKKAMLLMMGFTDRSQIALVQLLGLSDKIADFEAELRKAGGTTESIAQKQLESLNSKLTILKNNVVNVALEVGFKLQPAIESISEMVIRATESIESMGGATFDLSLKLLTFGIYIGPATMMVLKFGPAIAAAAAQVGILIANVGLFPALAATAVPPLAALMVVAAAAAVSILKVVKAYEDAVLAEAAYRESISKTTRAITQDLRTAIEAQNAELLKGVVRQSTSALAGVEGAISDIDAKVNREYERQLKLRTTLATMTGNPSLATPNLEKIREKYAQEISFLETEKQLLENNIRLAQKNIETFKGLGIEGIAPATGALKTLTAEQILFKAEIDELFKSYGFEQLISRVEQLNGLVASGAVDAERYAGMKDLLVGDFFQNNSPFGTAGFEDDNEIRQLDSRFEQIEAAYKTHADRLEEIEQSKGVKLNELRQRLDDEYTRNLQQYQTARKQLILGTSEDIFGSLAGMSKEIAGEQSGIYKAMFAVQKAFSIAQSIVAIQSGIAQAAANPWPTNLAAMASVAAATAGIISSIRAVQIAGFEGGGMMAPGPRTGGMDGRGGKLVVMHPNEKITDLSKGGDGTGVVVNVINQVPSAQSSVNKSADGKLIEVLFTELQNRTASDISTGNGPISRALESGSGYALRRNGR